jgi:hypothetical protein
LVILGFACCRKPELHPKIDHGAAVIPAATALLKARGRDDGSVELHHATGSTEIGVGSRA